jgi:hypothetical protein
MYTILEGVDGEAWSARLHLLRGSSGDRVFRGHQESRGRTLFLVSSSKKPGNRSEPANPAGHHVMDRAGIFDLQRSGRGPILSHGARLENRKPDLTPRSSLDTPWDPLHRAYFNGYAMWTYLTTPFFMAIPASRSPRSPHGQKVVSSGAGCARFPDEIASHSKEQDFDFGNDFLLRRHDYHVDVAAAFRQRNTSTTSWRCTGFAFQRSAVPMCVGPICSRSATC